MFQRLHIRSEHPELMASFLAAVFDVSCQSSDKEQESFLVKIPQMVTLNFHPCRSGVEVTQGLVMEWDWLGWSQHFDEWGDLDMLHQKIEFILYSRRDEFPAHLFQLRRERDKTLVLLLGKGLVLHFI